MIKESGIVEKNANELLGDDAACFALLLHLTTAISGFNEGPFRAGFEMAIEEGGAYLDSEAGDGGTQAQTLMEQMIGLVSGVYALTEIKGPMGIVAEEKEETRWKERALAAESSLHRVRGETIEECAHVADDWREPSTLRLRAGEMTAQEMRTSQAVARGISSSIRSLASQKSVADTNADAPGNVATRSTSNANG